MSPPGRHSRVAGEAALSRTRARQGDSDVAWWVPRRSLSRVRFLLTGGGRGLGRPRSAIPGACFPVGASGVRFFRSRDGAGPHSAPSPPPLSLPTPLGPLGLPSPPPREVGGGGFGLVTTAVIEQGYLHVSI